IDIPKTPFGDETLIFLLENFDLFDGRRIKGGKQQRNILIQSIFYRLIKYDKLKQYDIYSFISRHFHIENSQVRHIVYDK
ncbi:MAG: hypothetical protein GWP19_00645, partial [Planctomycetia bacterium]|nr:hypothetical protein [Planctomycetia bacterium]